MEREKKIVDASVLVKLFSIEEDSNKAEYLIKNHVTEKIILIIPELLFLEVSNALKYKKNDENKIKEANEKLWDFQFHIERLNKNIMDLAIKIALENNFTIYDSLYIALAQIYGAELITADEALLKIPNVKLLKYVK